MVNACGKSGKDSAVPSPARKQLSLSSGASECAGLVDALPAGNIWETERDSVLHDFGCTEGAGFTGLVRRDGKFSLHQKSGRRDLGEASRFFWDGLQARGVDLATSEWWSVDVEGESSPRGALALPPMRPTASDSPGFSFDELCFRRDALLNLEEYAPSSSVTFAPAVRHGVVYALISTCGYVVLRALDTLGQLKWEREVLVRPPLDKRAFWAALDTPAEIAVEPHTGRVSVVAKDFASDHKENPGRHDRFVLKSFRISGEPVLDAEWSGDSRRLGVRALADCGSTLVLAGSETRSISGGPNESREDDVWLAAVDARSGALLAETSLDVKGDDLVWSAACSEKHGVFVGGQTEMHHVDSGSWLGGSRALLLRFDKSLRLQEEVRFGNERMNSVSEIVLGERNLLVWGDWDGTPTNHYEPSEDWWASFVAVFPLTDWRAEKLNRARPFVQVF